MNFANMNPAERLKASGLIGLIVVILFFVVHTMLGAVSPKSGPQSADPPPGGPPAVAQTAVGGPPPSSPPGAVASLDNAFPQHADPNAAKDIQAAGLLKSDVDPFMPLQKGPAESRPAGGAPAATAPKLDIHPVQPSQPSLPFPGAGNRNFPSSFNGGGLQVNPANGAPAGPEPEIRVIGVVNGDESVATLDVGGRVRIYRPGEALAKGYRLDGVDEEGVRLRHDKKTTFVRVGAGINESVSGKPGG